MPKTQLTGELYRYSRNIGIREHPLLQQLRQETLNLRNSQMLLAPEQGALIALLAQIANCVNYLEIGMFTGYSALWLALALPPHATITTLEINDSHLELAQRYWQAAGVKAKITPIIAPALLSLQQLRASQQQFDMVFIDANKSAYLDYYELSLELLKPQGLIIIDNVFMYGQVLDSSPRKKYITILQQLNQLIYNDQRVDICLVPIADGMTIARKRSTNETQAAAK